MPDSQSRLNEIVALLRAHGFRLTPQRMALLHLIAASEGHPNAAQLYVQVKKQFSTMSLASVYKTLNLLKELGQIQEIDLRDDSRYDGNRPEPHSHLVCTQCQTVVDDDFNLEPSIVRKMEHTSGYQILRQQIVVYGLCSECRAKASRS